MKLTNEQKNKIYKEVFESKWSCDSYEWLPAINFMLETLGYEDRIICNEDYEFLKWK